MISEAIRLNQRLHQLALEEKKRIVLRRSESGDETRGSGNLPVLLSLDFYRLF